MFAHHNADLPEILLPDDVADLLAWLGTGSTGATSRAPWRPPTSPAWSRRHPVPARWIIPSACLFDVVAAVLQRRELRAAAPGRRSVGPLERYHLPAARLLMKEPTLSRYVPARLRHQVKAEERDREEAARQTVQRRIDEAERVRRAEERWQAAEFKRIAASATLWLYSEARWRAMAVRFPLSSGADFYETEDWRAFEAEWPDPKHARTGGGCRRTCWWPPSSCGAHISTARRSSRRSSISCRTTSTTQSPGLGASDAVADRARSESHPGVAAAERLRRLASRLQDGDDDGRWLAQGLVHYLAAAPSGLDLDRALGLATEPGGSPWWRVPTMAERDQLLRDLAADLGDSVHARATALQQRLRRYAAGSGPATGRARPDCRERHTLPDLHSGPGCGSAPKRDPHRFSAKPLMNNTISDSGWVPIGADRNPCASNILDLFSTLWPDRGGSRFGADPQARDRRGAAAALSH